MSLDLDRVVSSLNQLLAGRRPAAVNSSWIRHHAPACYRFIRKWIRTETGDIWDRVTSALDPAYQKRWKPRRRRKFVSYTSLHEVNLALKPYRNKLYVFVAAPDLGDRRTKDRISIALVRVAQRENVLAKRRLVELIGHTTNGWIEHHPFLSAGKVMPTNSENRWKDVFVGIATRDRFFGTFTRLSNTRQGESVLSLLILSTNRYPVEKVADSTYLPAKATILATNRGGGIERSTGPQVLHNRPCRS